MKPSIILEEGLNLISDPNHFTKSVYARNVNGDAIEPEYNGAISFCSIGAIRRACLNLDIDRNSKIRHIAQYYIEKFVYDTLANFNDTHEHSEVTDLWKIAILSAKRDEENYESLRDY